MGITEQTQGSVSLKNPIPFCSVQIVGSAYSVLPMLNFRFYIVYVIGLGQGHKPVFRLVSAVVVSLAWVDEERPWWLAVQ